MSEKNTTSETRYEITEAELDQKIKDGVKKGLWSLTPFFVGLLIICFILAVLIGYHTRAIGINQKAIIKYHGKPVSELSQPKNVTYV